MEATAMFKTTRILFFLTLMAAVLTAMPTAAYASASGGDFIPITDEFLPATEEFLPITEEFLPITDQPDKLILELGPEWAGVAFELITDAGVFPVPVIVDASGVLRMDLGGSRSYTLSCVQEAVAVPSSEAAAGNVTGAPPPPPTAPGVSAAADGDSDEGDANPATTFGIPTSHLILFLGGLVVAVVSLIVMLYLKRRRESYEYYDDDDDYYDE
jgi:hypothetical protein